MHSLTKKEMHMKLYNTIFMKVRDKVSDNSWSLVNKSLYNKVDREKVGYLARHIIKDALFESFNNSTYCIGIKAQEYEFCRNAN